MSEQVAATPQGFYATVWVKEHRPDHERDWPFRFAKDFSRAENAALAQQLEEISIAAGYDKSILSAPCNALAHSIKGIADNAKRFFGEWTASAEREKALAQQVEELKKDVDHFAKQNLEWANCATNHRGRAETAERQLAEMRAAANVLIDYCEAHNWGTMPEPFASINPLLKLLGRE